MGILKTQRTANVFIIVLVIMNITLLATFWYKFIRTSRNPTSLPDIGDRSPGIPDPGDRIRFEEGLKRFLKNELNFSADQQDNFLELQRNHLEHVRKTQQLISELRKKLIATMEEEKVASEYIDSVAAEIGERTAAHEKSVLAHFKALSDICNPDQKEKYKKLLHQILEQLTPRGDRFAPPRDGRIPPPGNQPPLPGHRPPPRNM